MGGLTKAPHLIISCSIVSSFFKIMECVVIKNKVANKSEECLTNKNKEKKAIIGLLFLGFVVSMLVIYLVITFLM